MAKRYKPGSIDFNDVPTLGTEEIVQRTEGMQLSPTVEKPKPLKLQTEETMGLAGTLNISLDEAEEMQQFVAADESSRFFQRIRNFLGPFPVPEAPSLRYAAAQVRDYFKYGLYKRDVPAAYKALPGEIAAGFISMGKAPFQLERMRAELSPEGKVRPLTAPGMLPQEELGITEAELSEKAKQVSTKIDAFINEAFPLDETVDWNMMPLSKLTQITARGGLPSMAVAMGASLLTGSPWPGLIILGGVETGGAYERQRMYGETSGRAALKALASGGIEIVTEKIPFDFLMHGKMLTGPAMEAMQEKLAGLGQNYIDEYTRLTVQEGIEPIEASKQAVAYARKQSDEDAIAGGVIGLLGAGAVATRKAIAKKPEKGAPLAEREKISVTGIKPTIQTTAKRTGLHSAVKLKTGEVISSPTALTHEMLIKEENINFEDVLETGWFDPNTGKYLSTPPETVQLDTLPWRDLQQTARDYGVNAFQKRDTLVEELTKKMEQDAIPIAERLGGMSWKELQTEARKRGVNAFQKRSVVIEELLKREEGGPAGDVVQWQSEVLTFLNKELGWMQFEDISAYPPWGTWSALFDAAANEIDEGDVAKARKAIQLIDRWRALPEAEKGTDRHEGPPTPEDLQKEADEIYADLKKIVGEELAPEGKVTWAEEVISLLSRKRAEGGWLHFPAFLDVIGKDIKTITPEELYRALEALQRSAKEDARTAATPEERAEWIKLGIAGKALGERWKELAPEVASIEEIRNTVDALYKARDAEGLEELVDTLRRRPDADDRDMELVINRVDEILYTFGDQEALRAIREEEGEEPTAVPPAPLSPEIMKWAGEAAQYLIDEDFGFEEGATPADLVGVLGDYRRLLLEVANEETVVGISAEEMIKRTQQLEELDKLIRRGELITGTRDIDVTGRIAGALGADVKRTQGELETQIGILTDLIEDLEGLVKQFPANPTYQKALVKAEMEKEQLNMEIVENMLEDMGTPTEAATNVIEYIARLEGERAVLINQLEKDPENESIEDRLREISDELDMMEVMEETLEREEFIGKPPTPLEGAEEELQAQYQILKESGAAVDPPRTQDEADDLMEFLRSEIAAYEQDDDADSREDVHRMKTALAALQVIRKTLPKDAGKAAPPKKPPEKPPAPPVSREQVYLDAHDERIRRLLQLAVTIQQYTDMEIGLATSVSTWEGLTTIQKSKHEKVIQEAAIEFSEEPEVAEAIEAYDAARVEEEARLAAYRGEAGLKKEAPPPKPPKKPPKAPPAAVPVEPEPAPEGRLAPPTQLELDEANKALSAQLTKVEKIRKQVVEPATKKMRKQQIAKAMAIEKAVIGEGASAAEVIRRSKGGYKVDVDIPTMTPLELSPAQWDAYSRQVYSVYPGPSMKFQQTTAQGALDKLRTGHILIDSELALLIPVMGVDVVEELQRTMAKMGEKSQRNWNLLRDIILFWKSPFNYDLQFVRNAINFLPRHPVKYTQATVKALEAYASKDYARNLIDAVKEDPEYEDASTYLNFLETGELTPLNLLPEQYRGRLPSRLAKIGAKRGPLLWTVSMPIRGIGRAQLAAERSFVASANWFMLELWKQRSSQWEPSLQLLETGELSLEERKRVEDTVDKHKKNYGDVVNTYMKILRAKSATGRAIQTAANFVLWSPSMTYSRFKRPKLYLTNSGSRGYAMQLEAATIAKTYLVMMAMTAVANYFRDDDDQIVSEMDPRSSNWGKFKLGDTWFDLGGGETQHYRTLAQFVVGEVKTQSGRAVEIPRWDIAKKYAQGRETALIGVLHELLTGETVFGQKVWDAPDLEALQAEGTVTAEIYAEAWRKTSNLPAGEIAFLTGRFLSDHLMPAALVSFAESAVMNGWPQAVAAGVAEAMALSAQSYKARANAELNLLQDALAEATYKKEWENLTPQEQKTIRRLEPILAEKQVEVRKEQQRWATQPFERREEKEIEEKLFNALTPPVQKELEKLGLTAGSVSRRWGSVAAPYYLNEVRFERYVSLTQVHVGKALDRLFGRPKYKKLLLPEKEAAVRMAIADAKTAARIKLEKLINAKKI